MNDSPKSKAQKFYDLHVSGGCFLMPNAWDAGSAKMLAAGGFAAIATTSAGIAFSHGQPDHCFCDAPDRMNRQTMIQSIRDIAAAVSIPVNADLEAGFGDTPEDIAETIRQAIVAGAAGGNIEDYTGDKANPLYETSLSVERIKAARETIKRSKIPFVLVGRTDCFLINHPDAFSESVRRANLYREAGADCLFVPGVSERETIASLVREIDGPINIVMGLTGNSLSVTDLKELGVRRISIGGSLTRAIYYQIQQATKEMAEHGTFRFADKQIPQTELNRILISQ